MIAKEMASVVEEAKIFLHGAEIKRRMIVETAEGKNTAVFYGLPQDVRQESIIASIEKGGILASADFEVDSFKEPAVSSEIEALKKKLEDVKSRIKRTEHKKSILKTEEKFLDTNSKIGGNTGVALKELKEAESYYRERKEEIGFSLMKIDCELEDLAEEKQRIEKEIGGPPTKVVRYSGKITVEFYSESKGEAEIVVSYYVNGVWWRPFHEIRTTEAGAQVVLSMKGRIIQNTGEDWNDVKVKLSTGNPTLGNSQPVIRPWYIDMGIPGKASMLMEFDEKVSAVSDRAAKSRKAASPEPMMAQATESQTTTEFTLPAPMSIASSNKPSKVEITRHVLEAEVLYYCVSKLDTDAFLIAKIKGWESLNLLPGEVSIFQGNEYVGKTYLDPANAEDDMEISLGRDRAIIVTRERGKDMASKGLIGKNNKMQREWSITVRNTRSKGIKMNLIDQIPVSVNSELTVEAADLSGADLNKETGILTWSLDIPAGGSVKKTLRYTVTYPKNGTVYLD